MSSPAAKRARLHEPQPNGPWANLEPGILESVFQGLCPADKRRVRLVCKAFSESANRTIHHLDLTHSGTVYNLAYSSLKVSPLDAANVHFIRLFAAVDSVLAA